MIRASELGLPVSSVALFVAAACIVGGLVVAARQDISGPPIAIILMGLGVLLALGLAFALERHQARRAAERVAELEQLSADLIRANRAKSEFLANVSHELRTPLNAIVGFAELLRDGAYGSLNTRQIGSVERIESSAAHLQRLVDQILDLARIAAGRMELAVEPVDLRAFVIDIATEMESLINEREITLSLTIGTTLPRVHTDPAQLRQIATNLLGNAIKFTAHRGSITMRARHLRTGQIASSAPASPGHSGEWVVLQVIDTGIGIPATALDRIFDDFEQAHVSAPGATQRGTGLGLSISRRLARLLGGDITVESEIGRGSMFSVWLPINAAPSREAAGPGHRQPSTF